ncbi:MAG: hypothetical protein K0S41_2732 [Anaerocolumna sp.]|nr:hypothetical protein [Anaerocolumna sp.]
MKEKDSIMSSEKKPVETNRYSIFEYKKSNFIDLDHMGIENRVVAGQISLHLESKSYATLRIRYNCYINYSVTVNKQLYLMFRLYRRDSKGLKKELISIPYTLSFNGTLGIENENSFPSIHKNESFYMEYIDELNKSDLYIYEIELDLIYSDVDVSSIEGGFITIEGQITKNS